MASVISQENWKEYCDFEFYFLFDKVNLIQLFFIYNSTYDYAL